GAFSWDYVLATGFGGEARGEVLACPGPEPYWTPGRAAAQWWDSPSHFKVLYADPYANALACSANGVRSGIVISSTIRRKGRTIPAGARARGRVAAPGPVVPSPRLPPPPVSLLGGFFPSAGPPPPRR